MKTTFTILMFVFSLCATAQAKNDSIIFRSNENGFFKTISGTNSYIIQFDGKTAHDLYNDLLVRICRTFKSPENVTEKMVEDRAIVINASVNELIAAYENDYSKREWFDFFYRFEFIIKDGKIKIYAPNIVGGRIRLGARTLQHATYYPDNYVLITLIKDEIAKVPILEKYLNDMLTYIVYGNQEEENW